MEINQQIRILIGHSVRSGTNYVGALMNLHPDVITIPPWKSNGELNLFKGSEYAIYFKKILNRSFGLGLGNDDLSKFLPFFGNAWIDFLIDKYRIKNIEGLNKVIFIKTPFIENWETWTQAFPEAKICFLTRDGRDNVASVVKAANDKRHWHPLETSIKKRINYYSGRSFYYASKSWAKKAKIFHAVKENENVQKLKYEELLTKAGVIELLNFFELDFDQKLIDELMEAPVVGSSWGVQQNGVSKPNWKPDFDKKKFRFTGKWKNWSLLKKYVFRNIAGDCMRDLGYSDFD